MAGKINAKANARAKAIRRLSQIPGIGSNLARSLVARGVTTRAGLRSIAVELPPAAQAELKWKITRSIPPETALSVAAELKRRLRFGSPPSRFLVRVVGSLRRKDPGAKKDIDLLVVLPDGDSITKEHTVSLARKRAGDRCKLVDTPTAGHRHQGLVVKCRSRAYAVDLFFATRKELPFALFHYTGGKKFNIRTRAHAKRRGWRLNQYGLFVAGTQRLARGAGAVVTERDLFRLLGVTYQSPKNRE